MKTTGYTVTRSDGVTYQSIAAAARANHIAESTMQRYINNGTKSYLGFSFRITGNSGNSKPKRERLSKPAICPMCGRNTYCMTGFCQYCSREVRSLNRKEDAYKAASVVA